MFGFLSVHRKLPSIYKRLNGAILLQNNFKKNVIFHFRMDSHYVPKNNWSKSSYLKKSVEQKRSVSLPTKVKDFYYHYLFKNKYNQRSGEIARRLFSTEDVESCNGALTGLLDDDLILYISNTNDLNHLSKLEDECCSRVMTWSKDSLLQTAAVFYVSGYSAKNFIGRLMSAVNARFQNMDMSKCEILQVLFFVMLHGDAPEQLMMIIEEQLENASFNSTEISLICMAFFLSNRRLKSQKLLKNLTDKFRSNINDFDPAAINNVLKALRHASHVSSSLCDILGNHVINLNRLRYDERFFINVMELCRYFASIRYGHENFLKILVDRLNRIKRPMNLRSKDYAQLLMCLAQFNVCLNESSLHQCELQLTQFRKEGQYDTYPEALVTSLHALVMMGSYPQDLLQFVLSSGNIRRLKALPHVEKSHQLLILYIAASIENPDSNLHLPKWFVDTFPTNILGVTRHELNTRIGLDRVLAALVSTYGRDMVQCRNILPCFQTASIELHLDPGSEPVRFLQVEDGRTLRERLTNFERTKGGGGLYNNRPVTSTEIYDELIGTKSETINVDMNVRRLCIEVLGYHQCAVNTGKQQGLTSLKQRLLKKLGYDVIVIPPENAKKFLDMSEAEVKVDVLLRIRDVTVRTNVQTIEQTTASR